GAGLRRRLTGDGADPFAGATAYRLLEGEPAGAGIRRIVLARVDDALAELRGETASSPAEAVHEARKDVKKVRAALRLVRGELGDEVHRRENTHYRDVGRMLSEMRDAEVRVESLDALIERFDAALEGRFARLREAFESELAEARDGGSLQRSMAEAAAALNQGRPRVSSLPLAEDGWEALAPGVHRSYRRGRKRMNKVTEEPSAENLHDWRRRVKDLWYQLRIVRVFNPALIGQLIRETDDLADHLGDDHDLALLREQGARRVKEFDTPDDQRLLFELIDRRRGELQFAAISLGHRVYKDKPKRFLKRLVRPA
ncbi:MAG: CHAD domain-containing protein, partial [Actinomycetota bacterium]|nr:CHAD domain-containing protein [Actinomycetota bacterium]